MPKTRMTALDIRAIVNEMRFRLLGTKVSNVYEISSKTYILKLSNSKEKTNLLIESGIRMYLTEYSRDKLNPSNFVLKVRKHIRNKRIDSIRQIGYDRVVDIAFGLDTNTVHLVLEFYAGGNIILTDCYYNILALLRPYKLGDDTVVNVKQQYDISPKQHDPFINISKLSVKDLYEFIYGDEQFQSISHQGTLFKYISAFPLFTLIPSSLLRNCLAMADLEAELDINTTKIKTDQLSLFVEFIKKECLTMEHNLINCKGFVSYYEKDEKDCIYTDYNPILMCKNNKEKTIDKSSIPIHTSETHSLPLEQSVSKDTPQVKTPDLAAASLHNIIRTLVSEDETNKTYYIDEYNSFSECLDVYYKVLDQKKNEQKEEKERINVNLKVLNIQQDQYNRIQTLQNEESNYELKAQLIEYNIYIIDIIILYMNKLLASKMSWTDIDIYIQEQKEMNNYIYTYINSIHLGHSYITLYIYNEDQVGELVDIYIDRNAYSNVILYYSKRKEAMVKRIKTEEAAEKTIEEAKKQASNTLSKQVQSVIYKERTKKWFEKYSYFITRDRYLCIAGRDMTQNEQIVKRYLRSQDLYVHADIVGASSVVIRNKYTDRPIPYYVIQDCAMFAVCHSSAWERNIPVPAYYVYANQVSKTAPAGEYLTTGSFMIRGKKNYVPVNKLEMGLGYMFVVSDESKVFHDHELKGRDIDQITAGPSVPMGDSSVEMNDTYTKEESVEDNKEIDINENNENSNDTSDNDENENDENENDKNDSINNENNNDHDSVHNDVDINTNENDIMTNDNSETSSISYSKYSKKRMSAKEKQLMKRAKELGISVDELQQMMESDKKNQNQSNNKKKDTSVKNVSTPKRGHRNDKKKHDLDEDDYELLRQSLLQSSKQGDSKKKNKKNSKQKTSKETKSSSMNISKNSVIQDTNNVDTSIKDVKEIKNEAIEAIPEIFCYSCGSKNHIQLECPFRYLQDFELEYRNISVEEYKKMKTLQTEVDNNENNENENNENNNDNNNDNENNNENDNENNDNNDNNENDDENNNDNENNENENNNNESEVLNSNETMNKPKQSSQILENNKATVKDNTINNTKNDDDKDDEETDMSDKQDQELYSNWISNPVNNDELLYCIPISAPYSTLIDYKYKVKILPGKSKKGKLIKEISELFKKTATQKEKDVMKTISIDYCMTVLQNNSKLGISTGKKH